MIAGVWDIIIGRGVPCQGREILGGDTDEEEGDDEGGQESRECVGGSTY